MNTPNSAVPARMGIVKMLVAAAKAWEKDRAPTMGAALSYYTIFSLAPLLLIVISVAGFIFDVETVRNEIFRQLNVFLGIEGAQTVDDLLQSINKPVQGILASIVGVIVMLIGATTVFAELQASLDHIWRAPARENGNRGLIALLRARVLSLGMILGIGFLLTVSLILSAVFAAMQKWWAPYFGGWDQLLQMINASVGFMLTIIMFAMIYKYIPRVRMAWSDVWMGAIMTTVLFTIGRFFISLYVGYSGVTSGFGAAGSLIVVLVWVYYSAQIFLYGAEFTWVYAHTYGSLRESEIKLYP